MSEKLASLAIQLSADIAKFESDMGRAARIAKKESDRMKRTFKLAMKAMATSTVTATASLLALTKQSASAADHIGKLSQRLGASTEFLSQMRHTTELTGVSFKTFTTGLQRMVRRLSEVANTGKGEAAPALEALGISAQELKDLSPEEQFFKLADAMKGVSSQGERVRLAMKLFDTEGVALVQTMQNGSQAIKDMNAEADRFGLTVSQGAADSAAKFNDELTRLGNKMQGIGESIGNALLPAMTEIIEQFSSGDVSNADQEWQGLQTTLATVYGGVLMVKAGFEALGQTIGLVTTTAVQGFSALTSGLDVLRKRFVQGVAEIGGIFSDDMAGFARHVEQDAKKTEDNLKNMLNGLKQLAKDEDIGDIFEEAFSKAVSNADKVRNAYSKTGKSIKSDTIPSVKSLNTEFSKTTKTVKDLEKELNNIGDDFDGLFESLMTPLEALNEEYKQQVSIVNEYMEANSTNAVAITKGVTALERINKNYIENRKAIEDTLTPYQEYIESLKEQLDIIGLSSDALLDHIARQELSTRGITAATVGQEEFNKKLSETVGLYKQIDAAQGRGQRLNGISSLISGLDGLASSFENVGRDIGRGLQNFSQSFGQTLNSLGSLSSTFKNSKLFQGLGQIGQTLGVVGQVASFIDQITGGKLFGTDYALESAQTSFFVNQGGAGGQTTTTEVRQRSLFRGRQWRTLVNDLEASAQQAIESLFNQVQQVFGASALAVGSNLEQIITGAFEQNFDENGNLTSQFSTVLGRTFNESFEQFSQRLIAENIIAVLDSVLPQVEAQVTNYFSDDEFGFNIPISSMQMVNEASHLAEAYRDNATALLDFANFALQAVTDIQQGNALLESLTDTTAIVEELSIAGEKLADTYTRIKGATNLFEESLQLMGASLDMGREEFIRFATEIEQSAGGLERATGLWESYFETFYSSQELLNQQLQIAEQAREDLLSGLGLDSDISTDDFRDLFENILPTLSADAVVQWLEAAEAIGLVIDLEGQLAQQRQELTDLIGNIEESLRTEDMSAFALEMDRIGNEFAENMRIAREMGASERELGLIRAYANRQIQNAIQQIEQDIISLSNSLFGSSLDNEITALEQQLLAIENQIALLEQQQQAAEAAAQAAIQAYNAQQAALERVADFAQSLLTSSFSPLNPLEQFNIAYDQFFAAFSAAEGGDVDAINSLQGLAQVLLQLSQDVYASSGTNTNVFNSVLDALNSLGLGGNFIDPTSSTVPPELQALYDQQLLLQQQIADAQQALNVEAQQQQAQALLDMLEELATFQHTSIAELAESLGVPLQQLVDVLGLELSDMTDVLGNIAPTLAPPGQDLPNFGGDTGPDLPVFGEGDGVATLNNSIITESNQTQQELVSIREAIDEMNAEIRNLITGNAA